MLLLTMLVPQLAASAGLLEQGQQLRRQGRFEEAILSLQGLLKAEGGNARAWYELGLTYAGDGQYGRAADAYRLAISQGFAEPHCHCALALALRESHKPAAALAEVGYCLQWLPSHAVAWNLKGNIECDLGNFEEALQDYKKALEFKPAYPSAHFNLGLVLGALGRDQDSEAAFQEAIGLQPQMSQAWSEMGRIQLRQKRAPDALKSFQEARRLNPADADAAWGLARAWRAMGNAGKAREEEQAYKAFLQEADNRSYFKASEQSRRAAAREAEAWDRELP